MENRHAVLFAILTLAAGFRFNALGHHGFWQDEVHSLYLADDLTRVANPIHGHAPLFYTLLRPWLQLGRSEGWVRGLSAVIGMVVVLVVYRIARRELGEEIGLGTAFLVAVSPVAIWVSREARGYALLHLLALCAFWALLEARRTGRPVAFLLHGLAVAGALYTHYYALFLIPAFGLVLLLPSPISRLRLLIGFSAALAVAALVFLPWLPVLLEGQRSLAGYAREVNRFGTGNSFFLKTLLYLLARADPPHMVGAAAEALFPPRSFTALSLLALVAILALLARRLAAEGLRSPLLPWFTLAFAPTTVAVLGHYLGNVILGSRYVAFAGLFLAVPTAVLGQRVPSAFRWALVGVTVVLGGLGARPLYAHPTSEVREAVRFINSEKREVDCAATLSNKAFVYRFYAPEGATAIDLPWEVPGFSRRVTPTSALEERAVRDEDLPAIVAYFRSCGTTWVLYNEEVMWGVDMGGTRLRAALENAGFTKVLVRDFADAKVEAYRAEPAR